MIGGAFFHGPKIFSSDPQCLEDVFLFAGIGLEYDGASIKGASTELIISLVEEALSTRETIQAI